MLKWVKGSGRDHVIFFENEIPSRLDILGTGNVKMFGWHIDHEEHYLKNAKVGRREKGFSGKKKRNALSF